MNKSDLKQLIKEEIKKILAEEIDIFSELDSFFQNNPYTEENQWSHEYDAKDHIQNVMGRSLTPQEKSKVTKIVKKYLEDFWEKKSRESLSLEDKITRERYLNNLLPLTTDNGNGTPDSTYYTTANEYNWTDRDDNAHTSDSDPKSGYTDYKLKDKWINTLVDKATLDRYWHPGKLRMIGIKNL